MHLFYYFGLLAFLLLNVANKLTDEHPSKTKLNIFNGEQGANDHKSLRTTDLVQARLIVITIMLFFCHPCLIFFFNLPLYGTFFISYFEASNNRLQTLAAQPLK